MYARNAIKGGSFTAALVVLIFFLKIICPLETGCLVDPFLVVMFSPLYIMKITGVVSLVSAEREPFVILAFWILIGFFVGYLVTPFVSKRRHQNSSIEETF